MEEITVEVSFAVPKCDLSEKEQEYLNELIKEVLETWGTGGLFSALENFLGK